MKKHKLLFLLIISFLAENFTSQNIVNNPGMEVYSILPDAYNEVNRASGWSNCNGNYITFGAWGSPDYLSLLGSGVAQLPAGGYVSASAPHSGNGILGFVTVNDYCANCREYVRTSLTTPMVAGQTYSVSFWVTNGYNQICKYTSNNMGILFSKDSAMQTPTAESKINRIPQLNITTVIDSAYWKKYSFTYTSDSAYKFMTFGNFYTDAQTTKVIKNPTGNSWGYYMIDDVSVISENTADGLTEKKLDQNNISIFPNPGNGDLIIKGDKDETLEIINELGQCLFTVDLTAKNFYRYEITSLDPGIYFIIGKYSKIKIVVAK